MGDLGFCPTIRKTDTISKALEHDFSESLRELTKNYSPEILTKANNYLYKKETRSSYQIEKEEPTPERVERFVSLLSNAGKKNIGQLLSEESLVALQIQIVDPRFAAKGFRDFQNYIGQTTWNYDEVIHYICPPPEFLPDLMKDLSGTAIKMEGVNPIVRATAVAFGFVFIHPFEDGNGRIHRFLIHDFLLRDNFLPAGMIIPVSAHMVNNLKLYNEALEAYAKPLMQIIKYTKDKKQKLNILNASEVGGYYKFPDLTAQTEYLCTVIETAISRDLPNELNFLQNYDEAKELMKQRIDMPDIQEIKKQILKENEPLKTQMISASKKKSLEVSDPAKGEVIGIHKNQKTAFIKISSNQKCVIHINNVTKRFLNVIGDELKIGQINEGLINNIDPERGIEMTLLNY